MESSENSAWKNCPHFTTPPLVFPRLSILRATSGGVVEFWQLSQALKNLLWELILPQKYRWNSGGVVKKRVSRGWHLRHWSFHIQSWSLCNKSVESFLIVDILNSASRILQCWSYYVKINSARHCWFSFYILRDYCDVIQTYPYHDTGGWNFCMPKGSGEFLSWLDQTQQIPSLLRC